MSNDQIITTLEIYLLQHNRTLQCFNRELLELKARSLSNGDEELYKCACRFLEAIKNLKKPETIIIEPSLALVLH